MPPEVLLSLRYGYGAAACEGALSWPRVEVSTVEELRRWAGTDHTWVRVRGGYQDEGGRWHRVTYHSDPEGPPIDVAPSVVLDGFGVPHVTGRGFRFRHPHAIASGLATMGCSGDAYEITSGGRDICLMKLWIEGWGDEAVSLVRAPSGSREDTLGVSLLRSTITQGDKCILVGGAPGRSNDERYRLTVADVGFYNVGQRAPWRMRYAKGHALRVGVYGASGDSACILEHGARGLLQDCVFKDLANHDVRVSGSAALRKINVHGSVHPSQDPWLVTTPAYARGQ